jgi:hypothetical protein
VIFLQNIRHIFAWQSKTRRSVHLLLLCLALGCTVAQLVSAQDQQTEASATLQGTVINSVTHGPIARALVSYENRLGTLTDAQGRFELRVDAGNPGERFSLSAVKPGYLGYLKEPHSRSTVDVEASPGMDVTISLMPEALIIGRVTLSTGEPAYGVGVEIFSRQAQNGVFRWAHKRQTQTNSNGEFRFAELEAGSYKVLTREYMDQNPLTKVPGQLYGFPPVAYPNATDFDSANTIQLAAGETLQADMLLVQHPYFNVKISLANSPMPGSGMHITVSPSGHPTPGYSLSYNRQTEKIEGSLPDGNYSVEATTYEPAPRIGMVHFPVAGAPAEGASMALSPSGSITLNVREEFTTTARNQSGTWSIGGGTFKVHGPRNYLEANAEAADDFEEKTRSMREPRKDDDPLVIDGLAPGRYWLRLDSSVGYVASATMGTVDLLQQPFVMGLGPSTPVEITMRDNFAEIEGTVGGVATTATPNGADNAEENASLSGQRSTAYVYCVPLAESAGKFQQLGVDSQGKFDSQNMVPGSYLVLAFQSRQSNLPYRDAEAMRAYEAKGQEVRLSPGQKANVELAIIPDSD